MKKQEVTLRSELSTLRASQTYEAALVSKSIEDACSEADQRVNTAQRRASGLESEMKQLRKDMLKLKNHQIQKNMTLKNKEEDFDKLSFKFETMHSQLHEQEESSKRTASWLHRAEEMSVEHASQLEKFREEADEREDALEKEKKILEETFVLEKNKREDDMKMLEKEVSILEEEKNKTERMTQEKLHNHHKVESGLRNSIVLLEERLVLAEEKEKKEKKERQAFKDIKKVDEKKIKVLTAAGEMAGQEVRRLKKENKKRAKEEKCLKQELEEVSAVVSRLENHGLSTMKEKTKTTKSTTNHELSESLTLEKANKFIREIQTLKTQLKVALSNTKRAEESEMLAEEESEDLREQLLYTSKMLEVMEQQVKKSSNDMDMLKKEMSSLVLSSDQNKRKEEKSIVGEQITQALQNELKITKARLLACKRADEEQEENNKNITQQYDAEKEKNKMLLLLQEEECNKWREESMATERQIETLKKEVLETRRVAKHMESAAFIAQSEFLVLNQEFYDVATMPGMINSSSCSTPSSISSSGNEAAKSSSGFRPTTPASLFLRRNMPTGSARLHRAMEGVASLREKLVTTKKQFDTAEMETNEMKVQLGKLREDHNNMSRVASGNREELSSSNELVEKLRAELSIERRKKKTSSSNNMIRGTKTPESSPNKKKNNDSPPFRSPQYPPRYHRQSEGLPSSASSVSSNASTVGRADTTPSESKTSGSSESGMSGKSHVTFTPYSAFTPLSVKISRCAAQMSGSGDAQSDMDEMLVSKTGSLHNTKKAKRSIQQALEKEVKESR